MFIETISVKNGKTDLLSLHQDRMNRTYRYHFNLENPFKLSEMVGNVPKNGNYRLRVVYSKVIEQVEHTLYDKQNIGSLQVVTDDEIEYIFKYSNRKKLEQSFQKRNKKDNIIIVKQNMVTDSYYANLVFWNGNEWFTPRDSLLSGVRRQYLLTTGQIKSKTISLTDIFFFEKVGLINAMLDLGEVEVAIKDVFI